jgi:DNA-binding CsgD family transcriptional regulator
MKSHLSAREIQVLQLIADGHTGSQTAALPYVSYSTVKAHMRRIFTKLNVHTRAEAILAAIRLGVVTTEHDGRCRPAVTGREHQALQLLARGFTARDIAGEMGVGVRTVRVHTANLYDKLGVATRGGAVAAGVQHGLIER